MSKPIAGANRWARRCRCGWVLAAGILPGVPLLAQAQTSGAPATASTAATPATAVTLNSIVVTAQKRAQQEIDVPIPISAYSDTFLKAFGITHAEDLGRFVPGLQVQVQSPNNPGFAVRGITTDDGSSNAAARVSIFQDGVDISRSRGSVVALYDMSRIEVLRGPQGTLFGRGAESGAISLIQNKARNAREGGFHTEFGNYDSRLLTGFVNLPLASAVYARVAVYDSRHDGYIRNLAGGRLNGEDTRAIRTSLHFVTGAYSGIDLIANYQHDAPPGTDFRSAVVPNRHGSTDVFGDADLNGGRQLGLKRKVYGLTALGDFHLSDAWSLSTVTGWRRFDALEHFDGDGSQVDMLDFAEHAKSRQFSQEVRFNFDNGGSFSGFLGANYFRENGSEAVPFRTDERSLFPQLLALAPSLPGLTQPTRDLIALLGPPPPLLGPDYLPYQPYSAIPLLGVPLNPDEREGYTNHGSTRSYEVFADGTWRPGEHVELTAGLRVSREHLSGSYQVTDADPAGGIGTALALFGAGFNGITGPNDLFVPTHGRLASEHDSTSVVGRLIGTWHVNQDTHVYLGVSRGRRPNVLTFNVDAAGTGYDRQVLPAETIVNYELGMKGQALGGHFAYDLSAFYYDYNNFQSNAYEGGRLLTFNAGRARVPGFEAALQAAFGHDFSVFLNYSYLHARFADRDRQGRAQQYAGNHLRLAPDNSVALGILWNIPLRGDRTLYVRPSYTWSSRIYFEDNNNPAYAQSGYGLVDLRLGVSFDRGRWDLGLFGRNLTDRKYLIDGGNTGENFGLPTCIPGSPRTWGISLSGRF